jgi:hypothetical protein
MSQTLSAPGPLAFEGHANTPAIHLPDGTVQQPFLTPVQHPAAFRNGHVNLDTFSPVNENGSFEFDRVLKSQKVNRRVKPKHVRLLACAKFRASPEIHTNEAHFRYSEPFGSLHISFYARIYYQSTRMKKRLDFERPYHYPRSLPSLLSNPTDPPGKMSSQYLRDPRTTVSKRCRTKIWKIGLSGYAPRAA